MNSRTVCCALAPSAILLLAACSPSPASPNSVDSPQSAEWLVKTRAIGDTVDPYSHIAAVAVDTFGAVALIDDDHSNVVVFGPEGRQRVTFGRNGRGPGEFRSPHQLALAPSGETLVADIGNSRISRWSSTGRLLSTTPLPEPAAAVAWTSKGFAVAIDRGITRDVFILVHRRGAGGEDSLVQVAHYGIGDPLRHSAVEVTCNTCPIVINADLSILVGAPDTAYAVFLQDSVGDVRREWRRVGVPATPRPQIRLEQIMHQFGITNRSSLPAAFAYLPTVKNLSVDGQGRLFVQRSTTDSQSSLIDAFAPDGAFDTSINLPFPSTRIASAGRFLAVIAQDSVGFAHVELYTTH